MPVDPPLSTNVQSGDPGHAGLHNEERVGVNTLSDDVAAVQAGLAGIPARDFVMLQRLTASGAGAALTFDGFNQTFESLLLVYRVAATGSSPFLLRFNNDGGTNYTYDGTVSATQIQLGALTATNRGWGQILIPNYTSNAVKAIVAQGTIWGGSAGTAATAATGSRGGWTGTAAIARIDLFLSSGQLTAASTASLYGLR